MRQVTGDAEGIDRVGWLLLTFAILAAYIRWQVGETLHEFKSTQTVQQSSGSSYFERLKAENDRKEQELKRLEAENAKRSSKSK